MNPVISLVMAGLLTDKTLIKTCLFCDGSFAHIIIKIQETPTRNCADSDALTKMLIFCHFLHIT